MHHEKLNITFYQRTLENLVYNRGCRLKQLRTKQLCWLLVAGLDSEVGKPLYVA